MNDPAIPLEFRREQSGMSGGELLPDQLGLREAWIADARIIAELAQRYVDRGVHKSVVNRMLEPFMWHTAVVSSTEWENFLTQRLSPGAQPEMFELAAKIKSALDNSVPTAVLYGGWHLPYVSAAEKNRHSLSWQRQISVARVAGTSYARVGITRDAQLDLDLYQRLLTGSPPHWSPFEHVATPVKHSVIRNRGNFDKWHQLRHKIDLKGVTTSA